MTTPQEPKPQLSTAGPGGYPSPLPVMTILLVSALLAALGIIMVRRSTVPAVGWVFLAVAIVGVVYGVVLAVRNVQQSRTIQRRQDRLDRERADDGPREV